MKIVCASICKNESHNIPQLLQNLESFGIAELCGVDTGSIDNSVELFHTPGYVNVSIKEVIINPFDFSEAKNSLRDMIPYDADFVLHLDMDERIKSLPKILTAGACYGVNREEILYGTLSENITRLTPRTGWEWKYPIHELLDISECLKSGIYFHDPEFVISHYQLEGKDRYESLTEFYFEKDVDRLYFHRLIDLIHHKSYQPLIDLFLKYGLRNLTDQQKWLVVTNYQASLINLDKCVDESYFYIVENADSSSSYYYMFYYYDKLEEYEKAARYFKAAKNKIFHPDNELRYFNPRIKIRMHKLMERKIDIYNRYDIHCDDFI